MEECLTQEHAPPHMCYHSKFGRPKSNSWCIIVEILRKSLTLHVGPFKVIQSAKGDSSKMFPLHVYLKSSIRGIPSGEPERDVKFQREPSSAGTWNAQRWPKFAFISELYEVLSSKGNKRSNTCINLLPVECLDMRIASYPAFIWMKSVYDQHLQKTAKSMILL